MLFKSLKYQPIKAAIKDLKHEGPGKGYIVYLPFGPDAPRTPLGHYEKFISPSFMHMQHGNGTDAFLYYKSPAEYGPASDDTVPRCTDTSS